MLRSSFSAFAQSGHERVTCDAPHSACALTGHWCCKCCLSKSLGNNLRVKSEFEEPEAAT